ncbi:MAG: hypothetical protein WC707_04395 [Candidatus Babeliaceae bacterium]
MVKNIMICVLSGLLPFSTMCMKNVNRYEVKRIDIKTHELRQKVKISSNSNYVIPAVYALQMYETILNNFVNMNDLLQVSDYNESIHEIFNEIAQNRHKPFRLIRSDIEQQHEKISRLLDENALTVLVGQIAFADMIQSAQLKLIQQCKGPLVLSSYLSSFLTCVSEKRTQRSERVNSNAMAISKKSAWLGFGKKHENNIKTLSTDGSRLSQLIGGDDVRRATNISLQGN